MGKQFAKTGLPSVSFLSHTVLKGACISCFAVAWLSAMTTPMYAQVVGKEGKTVTGGGKIFT